MYTASNILQNTYAPFALPTTPLSLAANNLRPFTICSKLNIKFICQNRPKSAKSYRGTGIFTLLVALKSDNNQKFDSLALRLNRVFCCDLFITFQYYTIEIKHLKEYRKQIAMTDMFASSLLTAGTNNTRRPVPSNKTRADMILSHQARRRGREPFTATHIMYLLREKSQHHILGTFSRFSWCDPIYFFILPNLIYNFRQI